MNSYFLNYIPHKAPNAAAYLRGSGSFPAIKGMARFYAIPEGVLVCIEANGLPFDPARPFDIYACHIHGGESCTGNGEDPFADAGTHFNPSGAEHPYHAGDLPPLFGNYGFAWCAVFTSRFKIDEIIGKALIIHRDPDDFTTQPAGKSGAKIACGIIEKNTMNF